MTSHESQSAPGEVLLIRRVSFSASHRLHSPELDEAENERVFGPCARPNGHGHNYVVEVCVAGVPDPVTGMVVNLKDVKRVLHERIVADCDHRHLNLDVEWLRGVVPTAENLAVCFWRRLEDALAPARLHSVRVYETDDNIAEYRGGGTG